MAEGRRVQRVESGRLHRGVWPYQQKNKEYTGKGTESKDRVGTG